MPISDQNKTCWIAAAVLGLLVWIFTAGIGELSWFAGLVLGVVTAVLFGIFLDWLLCRGEQAVHGTEWDKSSEPQSLKSTDVAKKPSQAAVEEAAQPVATEEIAPTGDAQVPSDGTARPVSKRNDIYAEKTVKADEVKTSETVVEKPAKAGNKKPAKAKAKTAAKATTDKASTEKPAKAETKKKAEAKKTKKASKDGKKEARAAKVPVSDPDDLKEIKGVGPKLEKLLHKNGVTTFSQIAGWSDADVDHFADLIGRIGGRIRSDDWLGQAKTLAAGGSTEFSKRVEKGGVYA